MCLRKALYLDHSLSRLKLTAEGLKQLGLITFKTDNFKYAEKLLKENRFALVLLHYDTIGKGIFDICSLVRSRSNETVIVVLMAKIKPCLEGALFDSGVNDVVADRNVYTPALIKRIKTHLINHKSNDNSNEIRLEDTIIDFDKKEVWCNGSVNRLRGNICDLLRYFFDNPNRIISRDELKNSYIWSDSICSRPDEGGKTFDVAICKLRKIIEVDPLKPKIITSVRGVGWKLNFDIVE